MKENVRFRFRCCAALFFAVLLAVTGAFAVHGADPAEGEKLLDLSFDDGTIGGFMIYTNGGTSSLENSNGKLEFRIENCGDLDYANQAYRDGFSLVEGCEYHFSFDISCDITRTLEYRLQLNGGDYHAYYSERIEAGPEEKHISADFVMGEPTDPAPRLAFNAGIAPEMTNDPGGHSIMIDNIQLTATDVSGVVKEEVSGADLRISIVQAGLRPSDIKRFAVTDENEGGSFEVIREDTKETVYTGTLGDPVYDAATDSYVKSADFSDLSETGSYYLKVNSGDATAESCVFRISEDEFGEMFRSVFRVLYMQRCGTELDEAYAGKWHHGACHTGSALIYGTDQYKDVSGGWHDAGDYGRYVVPGAKTVADLFFAYEYFGADGDDFGIPESGNGIPDLLDEAKYELLWMLKMQDESGGVYHKVTCRNFPGVVMPEGETDELVLSPISAAATCDFAAVMAKAARIYKSVDPSFAAQSAGAAEKAWEWIKNNENAGGFRNPSDIVTGEYPDEDWRDEKLWAAGEIWLTEDLPEEMRKEAAAAYVREEQAGYPQEGLGWDLMTSYMTVDFAMLDSDEPAADKSRVRLIQAAERILAKTENDAYGVALGTDYPWGSNMLVANDALILLLAERVSGEVSYRRAAERMFDYLRGLNGMGISYITGFGAISTKSPHHRPSQFVGEAVPGMLSGGPDSRLEDPYAQGVLAGAAPALCYTDNDASYSTNEITIYWNSPLIALMAALS